MEGGRYAASVAFFAPPATFQRATIDASSPFRSFHLRMQPDYAGHGLLKGRSVLITAAGCAAGALRRLRSLESRSATLLLRM